MKRFTAILLMAAVAMVAVGCDGSDAAMGVGVFVTVAVAIGAIMLFISPLLTYLTLKETNKKIDEGNKALQVICTELRRANEVNR